MVAAPVFVCLSASGLAMARRLSGEFGNAEIHGLAGRAPGADAAFADTMGHLRELFAGGRPVIGICAAGILMRAIAPLLSDKAAEPPVLAVAEDGSAVVPLIGGHRGANEMARRLGAVLGIAPAITTAGDARFSVALDAPPPGWRLANPQHAKPVMAALLAGASARLDGEAGWLAAASLNLAEDSEVALIASERQVEGSETKLVYHPPLLALGVGCERGCPAEELIALVEEENPPTSTEYHYGPPAIGPDCDPITLDCFVPSYVRRCPDTTGDFLIGSFGFLMPPEETPGAPNFCPTCLGATGLAQCAELVWQLRGQAGPLQVPGARTAMTQNIGGSGATIVTHILKN